MRGVTIFWQLRPLSQEIGHILHWDAGHTQGSDKSASTGQNRPATHIQMEATQVMQYRAGQSCDSADQIIAFICTIMHLIGISNTCHDYFFEIEYDIAQCTNSLYK